MRKSKLLRSKIVPRKLQHIAKSLYYRSKSHIQHISNKVEKPPSEISFWRGFWDQNRLKIKKKSFRNRCKKSYNFQDDFVSIFTPFWAPWATHKSYIFQLFELLLSLPRHLGAKRNPRVLQESARAPFLKTWDRCEYDFGPFFHRFAWIV